MRSTQLSVTCFLKYQDEFLFIHRTKKKNTVDGNKLNGIGGKLESGEDFLHAAVRETAEETGYVVTPEQCSLAGMVRLEGGYEKDWVMGFFVITVADKNVPSGMTNAEGQLYWINKNELLTAEYELVDDLYYLWQYLIQPKFHPFFSAAVVNEHEKITQIEVSPAHPKI